MSPIQVLLLLVSALIFVTVMCVLIASAKKKEGEEGEDSEDGTPAHAIARTYYKKTVDGVCPAATCTCGYSLVGDSEHMVKYYMNQHIGDQEKLALNKKGDQAW